MLEVAESGTDSVTTSPDTAADGGDLSFEALVQATEDPVWKVRWDAVNALGVPGDPRGIPALVARALYDDNPHPRWRSLWAISSVGPEDSGLALPLLSVALQHEDPEVSRNAAVALAFFGQPEARPELLRGLDDPDPFRRWEAVFSLKKVGDSEVAQELIMLLDPGTEPETRVRQEAVLVLSSIDDDRVVPALLDSLLVDPSSQVRWRAAMGLSRLGDPILLDSLKQALITEDDAEVVKWIEEAITKSQ